MGQSRIFRAFAKRPKRSYRSTVFKGLRQQGFANNTKIVRFFAIFLENRGLNRSWAVSSHRLKRSLRHLISGQNALP